MHSVLTIFAMSLCVVSEAVSTDASIVIDRRDLHTTGGPAAANHTSTASDDVNCTTTDDVAAARVSMCPADCLCGPLTGQLVWTSLIVECLVPGTKHLIANNFIGLLDCLE